MLIITKAETIKRFDLQLGSIGFVKSFVDAVRCKLKRMRRACARQHVTTSFRIRVVDLHCSLLNKLTT